VIIVASGVGADSKSLSVLSPRKVCQLEPPVLSVAKLLADFLEMRFFNVS